MHYHPPALTLTELSPHLLFLIVYSIVLVVAGLWIARLVRGASDFFVAGRRLNAPLLFSTVLAANIGAGTTVGASGLAFRDGLSAWWWNGTAGLASLVLAFWVGPRIWRLAVANGFYTTGDFLEFRYGAAVRTLFAALLWMGTLFILAGQLIAGAAVLEVVAGVPKVTGTAIGALVMTIYFAAGGLLSSAWVNVLQLVVLMAGFIVAVPAVYWAVGGVEGIRSAPGLPQGFLNVLHSSGPGSGWTLLAVFGPSFMMSPGLVQKAYGAKDEHVIRVGIGVQGIFLLFFSFVPVFFGLAARVLHPDIASQNLVLPTILARDLPPWVGALGLAAVFSAEVSTCDAILFMLSTSMAQDFYKRFVNRAADERQVLKVARLAAVVGGAAGAILAVQLETILGALTIFYSLVGVGLFVPIVAGLASRRGGTPEALASMGAGIATLLVVHLATEGRGYGVFSPNLIGILAAAAGFVFVGVARGPRARLPRA